MYRACVGRYYPHIALDCHLELAFTHHSKVDGLWDLHSWSLVSVPDIRGIDMLTRLAQYLSNEWLPHLLFPH